MLSKFVLSIPAIMLIIEHTISFRTLDILYSSLHSEVVSMTKSLVYERTRPLEGFY
jgi:hypothetical protein